MQQFTDFLNNQSSLIGSIIGLLVFLGAGFLVVYAAMSRIRHMRTIRGLRSLLMDRPRAIRWQIMKNEDVMYGYNEDQPTQVVFKIECSVYQYTVYVRRVYFWQQIYATQKPHHAVEYCSKYDFKFDK